MLRLTEHHPLTKKFKALENYMDNNGIHVEWNGYHLIATDTETGVQAEIKDWESGEACTEIPYICETKLTQEDEN